MTNPEQKIEGLCNGNYIKFVDGKPVNCVESEATHLYFYGKFERIFKSDREILLEIHSMLSKKEIDYKTSLLTSLLERGPKDIEEKGLGIISGSVNGTNEKWSNLINKMMEE